jgi:NhaP-type Na+/H+ or K+/H+ antiporter
MSGASNSYHAASIIVFAVIGLFLGTLLEVVLKNFNSPIPYTVLLFYLGVVLSAIVNYLDFTIGDFLEVSSVSADVIVYGFLPALLFSETMNLNWHHVTQTFGQAVLLAGMKAFISVRTQTDLN